MTGLLLILNRRLNNISGSPALAAWLLGLLMLAGCSNTFDSAPLPPTPTPQPQPTVNELLLAILEPDAPADLPASERATMAAGLDLIITQHLSQLSGITLVDRQMLDRVLDERATQEAALPSTEVAAGLQSFWAAGILLCTSVSQREADWIVTIEAVSSQTGQVLAELHADALYEGGQWHQNPDFDQRLDTFVEDLRQGARLAGRYPLVEVTDGRLLSQLTRLQWMVDDLGDYVRAGIGRERQVQLLLPRHPQSTKEERLLRLMGLASARPDDAAAGLAVPPVARLSVEVVEEVAPDTSYDKTAVVVTVIWTPAGREAERESVRGTVGGYDQLRQQVFELVSPRLASLSQADAADLLDEEACQAMARDELAAMKALLFTTQIPGIFFTFSPADNATARRLLRHALRAAHLDPANEEAAWHVAMLAHSPYYVPEQTEWSQAACDRSILECQRYLSRFNTTAERRDHVLFTLLMAAETGAVRAAGSRERLLNVSLAPLPETYRYSRASVQASIELAGNYARIPGRNTSNAWASLWTLQMGVFLHCPLDQLEEELQYWREYWQKHFAILERDDLPPWELAMVGYYARRGDWQNLRDTYNALARKVPPTRTNFWNDARVASFLKMAGDSQWQTWQPDFGEARRRQHVIQQGEEQAFFRRINPAYPDPFGKVGWPYRCSRLLFPKEVLTTGYRSESNVIQILCEAADQMWFVTPGLNNPRGKTYSHTLYTTTLTELAQPRTGPIGNDIRPQPVKIEWPSGGDETLPAVISGGCVYESPEGPVVWIATTLRGAARFVWRDNKWQGRWFTGQDGLPLDAIDIMLLCNWGGRQMLFLGGLADSGRGAGGRPTGSTNMQRVYWIMDPLTGEATIVDPPTASRSGAMVLLTWKDGTRLPASTADKTLFRTLDLKEATFDALSDGAKYLVTRETGTTDALKYRLWRLGNRQAGEVDPQTFKLLTAPPPETGRADGLFATDHSTTGGATVATAGTRGFASPVPSPMALVSSGVSHGNTLWMMAGPQGRSFILGYIPAPADDPDWQQNDQWIGPLYINGGGIILSLTISGDDHLWVSNSQYIDRLDISDTIEYARKNGGIRSTAQWREAYYRSIGSQGWRAEARQAVLGRRWNDVITIAADQCGRIAGGPEAADESSRNEWVDAAIWQAKGHAGAREYAEAIALYGQIFAARNVEPAARAFAGRNQIDLLHHVGRDEEVQQMLNSINEQFPGYMYDINSTRRRRATNADPSAAVAVAEGQVKKARPLPPPFFPQGPAPQTGPASDEASIAALIDDLRAAGGTWSDAERDLRLLGAAAVPAVTRLLKDDVLAIRLRAAYILGGIGKEAAPAVPELIEALEDRGLRATAMYALGNIGPQAIEAADLLLEVLVNAEEPQEARWRAGNALLQIDPARPDLMPAFLGNLEDKNPEVRVSATVALGKFSDARVKQALSKALWDDSPRVRSSAAHTLERGGVNADDVPGLVHVLQQQDLHGRIFAAQTLRALGHDAAAAVPALAELLKDPNPRVRTVAASALGRIGRPAEVVIDELRRLLEDEDLSVRQNARTAIRNIDRSE